MRNDTQPLAPVPDHVDQSRVFDFDLYNDVRYAQHGDMHAGLSALLKEAPGIFWSPRYGGHWVIISHELLFEASRKPDIFSSHQMSIPPIGEEPRQIPIHLDPPEHGEYRIPLMEAFAPKAMRALESDIRALAIELINEVASDGACDFVPAVAEPLPVMIFMKMMGLPLERLSEFRQWVRWFLSPDIEARGKAYMNVAGLMSELIAERRLARQDDLISRLLDAKVSGRNITDAEMHSYCLLLFIAGLDTVANAMAFAIRHLARDTSLQTKLRSAPDRIPDAVEEMLRRYTFTAPGRIVAKDSTLGGVRLRKGDRVLLMLPASGLDPAAFPDPMQFDLDRENKTHIGFNSGPHRCVGSHLARIELIVLYEEWLARIPPFRPDPERKEAFHGAQVLAIDSLPLVW